LLAQEKLEDLMEGFKAILCPVDFDQNSMEALELAKKVAATNRAVLHLFHVVPILPALGEPQVVSRSADDKVEEERARAQLEEIVAQRLRGIPCEIHLRDAFPPHIAEAVIRMAEEVQADLIVMATHGRVGISHFFLGSVAEKVVREAPCPVLSVRAPVVSQQQAASRTARTA
jgi:nucleotide-binding universal stress UspA family protein